MPASPESRISHSGGCKLLMYGMPMFSSPAETINSEIRLNLARMSAGRAASSASTVALRVTTFRGDDMI